MSGQMNESGRTVLPAEAESHPYLVLTAVMVLTGLYIYRNMFFRGFAYVFYGSGSDTAQQYIASMLNVVYKLRNGDFSLWEFNIGFGLDLLNNQTHIMDPFNIPFYLFGVLRMDRAMYGSLVFMQLLKCCMTGWFTMRFLDCFSFRRLPKLMASYCCAFCGFLMLWGMHYLFATACVYVSLIFWRLERSIQEKKYSFALTAAVAFALLSSLYLSYMIALACAIYLVIRMFLLQTEKGAGMERTREIVQMLGRTILSVLTAALLAAVILLPVCYQFTQVTTRLSGSASLLDKIRENGLLYGWEQVNWILLRTLSNNFLGTEVNYQGPVSYIEHIQLFFSLLTLPSLILFFAEGIGYSRKKKTYAAGLVLTLFLLFSPVTALLFNKGVNLATRYTFVLIPFAAFILASVLDRIDGFHMGTLLVSWILLIGCFAFFLRHRAAMDVFHLYRHFILTLAGALLFLALVTAFSLRCHRREGQKMPDADRRRRAALVLISCMMMANIMTDANITVNVTGIATLDDMVTQNGRLQWTQAGLDYVKAAETAVVRAEKTYSDKMIWNEPQGQDYTGISYYNTTYNKNVVQFIHKVWPEIMYMPALAHNYVVFRNNFRNSLMAALMNIRYIISTVGPSVEMEEYRLVSDTGVYVYENELAGGLGILFDRFVTEDALQDLEPEERQKVMRDTLVLEEIPEGLEAGKNGIADAAAAETYYRDHGVDFYRNGNDGHLYADVEAAEERQMLFISVPFDVGWTAAIDGKPVPVTRADYGFQAIQVPLGKSSVTLTYRTPLLREGAILSAVGILLILAECAVYGRRRKRISSIARS